MPETAKGAAPTSEGDFLTCKETAELLRLSEISVRRMLTQMKLKRYKVGARTLIRKSEALALIHEA
jgi:excisionase family DNA binding protein